MFEDKANDVKTKKTLLCFLAKFYSYWLMMLISALLISTVLKQVQVGILLLVYISLLRSFLPGYHFKKIHICFIFSLSFFSLLIMSNGIILSLFERIECFAIFQFSLSLIGSYLHEKLIHNLMLFNLLFGVFIMDSIFFNVLITGQIGVVSLFVYKVEVDNSVY